MSDDELTEFILEMLPSKGYLNVDLIVQAWIHKASTMLYERLEQYNWVSEAATMVPERLKQLEAEGRVRSSKRGLWRLTPERQYRLAPERQYW